MRVPAGHEDCNHSDNAVPLKPAPMTAMVGWGMVISYLSHRIRV
jgi:hypothetical protein